MLCGSLQVLTGNYNSKVDIWSLGCVVIEMATSKHPWSEKNFENPFRALYHIGEPFVRSIDRPFCARR